MNRAAVEEITSELEALLLPEYPYHAMIVRQLGASVVNGDMANAERQFASLAMWGGSGSVADVNLFSDAADERMNALLVRLVEHFGGAGITYPRATNWAETFKTWQRDGIFRNK